MIRSKILVDMHRLDKNPYNGLYTFSYFLGQALSKQPADNIDLNFYLGRENFGIFGDAANYKAHHSRDKFYMFNTSRFDLWHVTTSISWYHPFNRHTKNLFTLHDLNFLIEEKENGKRNKRLLRDLQERIDRAHHITAISNYVIDHARQFLDFGQKSISVIYNGCTVPDFPAFEEPPYIPQKKFILSIGLVQPRKNFHTLPALLSGNDLELIIAGINEFGYGDKIIEAAKKHGVANRVKLIGPVSENQKYWLLKNCEAFCFPSIAEGFGLPVLEAMHFGKPTFISNQTSLPEIGGTAAWYFQNFDAAYMQQVFNTGMQEYYQSNPAQNIRAQAQKFNWNRIASQYIALYKRMLS
ncbi:MAG: glycosyltransferase family 1 protein [Ginsengibacter sp.]